MLKIILWWPLFYASISRAEKWKSLPSEEQQADANEYEVFNRKYTAVECHHCSFSSTLLLIVVNCWLRFHRDHSRLHPLCSQAKRKNNFQACIFSYRHMLDLHTLTLIQVDLCVKQFLQFFFWKHIKAICSNTTYSSKSPLYSNQFEKQKRLLTEGQKQGSASQQCISGTFLGPLQYISHIWLLVFPSDKINSYLHQISVVKSASFNAYNLAWVIKRLHCIYWQ